MGEKTPFLEGGLLIKLLLYYIETEGEEKTYDHYYCGAYKTDDRQGLLKKNPSYHL